jgi:hypothetical protein
VGILTTAFQAPNMNAIAERFVGSIKRECLSKLILFGEDHLRQVIREFVEHYHEERPHQGLGNRRIRHRGEEPPGGMVRWSPTSDLAGCCAATAVRPDGQKQSVALVWNNELGHRSARSA